MNSLDPDLRLIVELAAAFTIFFIVIPTSYRLQRKFMYKFWGTYWALKRFIRSGGFSKRKIYHFPNKSPQPQSMAAFHASGNLVTTNLRSPNEKYAPWKEDYLAAYILWLSGIVWAVCVMYKYGQTQNAYLPWIAMLCVAPIYLGLSYLQSGQSRKRGNRIERKVKAQLKEFLPVDWVILPERMMETGGDIDLSIQIPNGEIFVIEIKSWDYWSGFVRKRKALRQLRQQRYATEATYSVVWLPVARKIYADYEGGLFIASGSPTSFVHKIQEIVQCSVMIRFPWQPPRHILSFVKSKGFVWDFQEYNWKGMCSLRQMAMWSPKLANHKGVMKILNWDG